jgi:hypothetical protein
VELIGCAFVNVLEVIGNGVEGEEERVGVEEEEEIVSIPSLKELYVM